jgi:small subunit ribosomal protein S17e
MKRIQKGTVRGISLKLQEEERERRFDFVPKVSFVDAEIRNNIAVDGDTFDMLEELGFVKLSNVTKSSQSFSKPEVNKKKPKRKSENKEEKQSNVE